MEQNKSVQDSLFTGYTRHLSSASYFLDKEEIEKAKYHLVIAKLSLEGVRVIQEHLKVKEVK